MLLCVRALIFLFLRLCLNFYLNQNQQAEMNRSKIFKWLVQISRYGLAALFLFTSGMKLFTLTGFAERFNITSFAVSVSELVGTRWAWPVAVAVIVIEFITAIFLLWPRAVRLGALFSALLLVGFAGYALYYVYVLHGEPLECGCFGGIIASQLGVSTALRNLALLVPSVLVLFGYPRIRRASSVSLEEPPAPPTLASQNLP